MSRLKALDLIEACGAQVRSRIKWVEEDETSSSYLFHLKKKHSADRFISGLRADDGSLVKCQEDLCAAFGAFYAEAQAKLLSHLSSPLPSAFCNACEGPLSMEECFAALQGMVHCKAPGNDGLPMEFYLCFWGVLGSDLVETLNSSFHSGLWSHSQRCGVISLSHKKGDRLDPRNWRPISLLNVDYKIASHAIAACLLKVIHLVVGRDQTCGVPGRFIGQNVAFPSNFVDFCSLAGHPRVILSLDQEKAFDRVDWCCCS